VQLDIDSEVNFLINPPWNDALANFVKAAQAYDNSHFAEAYTCLATTFQLAVCHLFHQRTLPYTESAFGSSCLQAKQKTET
jgi:hypothetical protein